ncbi:hypothetical protein VULLAG_LOCUS19536 [Vulpes lagopus]
MYEATPLAGVLLSSGLLPILIKCLCNEHCIAIRCFTLLLLSFYKLEQHGGSSSEQRFGFYPPQGPPLFPQILFPPPPQLPLVPIPIPLPFPFDPNQVLTLNDLITINHFYFEPTRGFLWEIILSLLSEIIYDDAGLSEDYLLLSHL